MFSQTVRLEPHPEATWLAARPRFGAKHDFRTVLACNMTLKRTRNVVSFLGDDDEYKPVWPQARLGALFRRCETYSSQSLYVVKTTYPSVIEESKNLGPNACG
jgi:hypothetical protein